MYGVEFVADHELPTEWALVRSTGRTRLFVRESAVTPVVLEQAWAAYRKSIGIVEQRRPPEIETVSLNPRSAVALGAG